jgi:hypothetical protein
MSAASSFLPVDTGLGVRAAVLELLAISPPSINGTALDGPGAESLATLKKNRNIRTFGQDFWFVVVRRRLFKNEYTS